MRLLSRCSLLALSGSALLSVGLLAACDSSTSGSCEYVEGDYLLCLDTSTDEVGSDHVCDVAWTDEASCQSLGYLFDCGDGIYATEETVCAGGGDDDDSGR